MSLDAFANICCCPCSCGVPPNLRSAYIVAWPGMNYQFGRTASPIGPGCGNCETFSFDYSLEIVPLDTPILQRVGGGFNLYQSTFFRVRVRGSYTRTCIRAGAINPPSGTETQTVDFRTQTEARIKVTAVGCIPTSRCDDADVGLCYWLHELSVANFPIGANLRFSEGICGNGGCDGPGDYGQVDEEQTQLHGGDGGLRWVTPYITLSQVNQALAGPGGFRGCDHDLLEVSGLPCYYPPTLGTFAPHFYRYDPSQPFLLDAGDYNTTRCGAPPIVATPAEYDPIAGCLGRRERIPPGFPDGSCFYERYSSLIAPCYSLS